MANYPMNPGQNAGGFSNQNCGYGPPSAQPVNAWGPSQPSSTLPFTGRYVNALTDIRPNEVPMDGRVALFPTTNLDEIYLKSWGVDGLIKTFRYVLDTSADLNVVAPQQPSADNWQQISNRLDQLEAMVKEGSKAGKGGSKSSQGEAK